MGLISILKDISVANSNLLKIQGAAQYISHLTVNLSSKTCLNIITSNSNTIKKFIKAVFFIISNLNSFDVMLCVFIAIAIPLHCAF